MFTVIVGGLLPPDVAQEIVRMAVEGLGDLFGEAGLPRLPR
jgi:hypothetical protein